MTIDWTCDKCNTKNEYQPPSSKGENGKLLMEMKTLNVPKPKEYVVICKNCRKQRKLIDYDF